MILDNISINNQLSILLLLLLSLLLNQSYKLKSLKSRLYFVGAAIISSSSNKLILLNVSL